MGSVDIDRWQFIAGGGENKEKPIEAARCEIFEEVGIEIIYIPLALTTNT